jgi:hypothetical protein
MKAVVNYGYRTRLTCNLIGGYRHEQGTRMGVTWVQDDIATPVHGRHATRLVQHLIHLVPLTDVMAGSMVYMRRERGIHAMLAEDQISTIPAANLFLAPLISPRLEVLVPLFLLYELVL